MELEEDDFHLELEDDSDWTTDDEKDEDDEDKSDQEPKEITPDTTGVSESEAERYYLRASCTISHV